MKTKIPFLNFLLLLSLYLVSGNMAFGASEYVSEINSEKVSTFNPNRNTTSVFVEEISICENFQTSAEEDVTFINFNSSDLSQVDFRSNNSAANNACQILQDKRKLLGQTIFPYHFFW